MFKASRWRSEKNKIKLVFKLQFQATQVPQLRWDSMMVSLVPLDVGKPTVRSEKAAVIDGTCHWENPIYETVKFIRDPKTGKINEKVYQFLVSANASPKAELLGEVTINLADYAEALKPSSVSLPLRASNSGAILHVTVQRMQADGEGREADENGVTTIGKQRRTLKSQLSNEEEGSKVTNDTNGISYRDDRSLIKSHTQTRFPSSRTISLHAESNGNLRISSSSDAISASGSDSSSGQYTPKENEMINNNVHQDSVSFQSLSNGDTPRIPTTNSVALVTDYKDHQRSNTDWSVSSARDLSMDESTSSSGESGSRERLLDSDVSLEKDRTDVVALARQVEVSELELQTLRKQIVKERRRGEDLSKEVSSLKEESDALRKECDELKASQKRRGNESANKSQFDGEGPWSMLEEIKQELNHEKNLNMNLQLQLQKTQESNSELILAVQDLDELLEQKSREISCTNCSAMTFKLATNEDLQSMKDRHGLLSNLQNSRRKEELYETISERENEEQYALEELVKEHGDAKVACSLEQKIIDLNSEIELYKKDREDLEMQMEQLALDYEILKQENHDISSKLEQTQLREQLRMQYDCTAHSAIIDDLEAHVESLEKELEKQAETFEADLATIMDAKVEQEKRAIQAEEALRKTKWNNVNTAERLQEEFKRLSAQMSSTFHVNEKFSIQAITEASELRMQKLYLEELLEKTSHELGLVQDRSHVKLQGLSSLIDFKTRETVKLIVELKDKSEELDNLKKSGEARQKATTEEMLVLRAEMERLGREKNHLSEQIEKLVCGIESLKKSTQESEKMLQDRNSERDLLEKELASVKEEGKKLLEEVNDLRHLKYEKEKMIGILNSEMATLREQHSDLKHSLFEDELEKENLRKKIFHLRADLQKKEDTITTFRKGRKDNSSTLTVSDGITNTTIMDETNTSDLAPLCSKEVASLQKRIKLLEEEIELKDATLEDSENLFLKKEKDLSNRIVELQGSMVQHGQNNPSLGEGIVQKDNHFNGQTGEMPKDEKDISAEFDQLAIPHLQEVKNIKKKSKIHNTNEVRKNGEILVLPEMEDKASMCDINDIDRETSAIGASLEEEDLISCPCDQDNTSGVPSEMAQLRESNKLMEAELKEMQERYSEISLKFAEVEGERQRHMITIRALKNARRN